MVQGEVGGLSKQLLDRLQAVLGQRDRPALRAGQVLVRVEAEAAEYRRGHLAGRHRPRSSGRSPVRRTRQSLARP